MLNLLSRTRHDGNLTSVSSLLGMLNLLSRTPQAVSNQTHDSLLGMLNLLSRTPSDSTYPFKVVC